MNDQQQTVGMPSSTGLDDKMRTSQQQTPMTPPPVTGDDQQQTVQQMPQQPKEKASRRGKKIGVVVASVAAVFVVFGAGMFAMSSLSDAIDSITGRDVPSAFSTFGKSLGSSSADGFASSDSVSVNSLTTENSSTSDVQSYTSDEPDVSDLSEKSETKTIYSGYETIETTTFDSTYAAVKGIVYEGDGYIESDYLDYDDYGMTDDEFRSAYLDIRVPEDKFDETLDRIENLDDIVITNKHIDAVDVTDETMTLESRLETAKSKLARLESIQESATTIDERLSVLDRITYQEEEIASLTDRIESYDDRVSYSSIGVTIEETNPLEIKSTAVGYGAKLSEAFVNGWNSGAEFFGSLLLVIVGNWLVIVVVAGVIVGAVVLSRRHRSGGKKSDGEKRKVQEETFAPIANDSDESAR